MKVLLVNGSPKHKGCTYTALSIVADELEKNGIDTEIFQVGMLPIRGCIGCGMCAKNGNGLCQFDDDVVNKAILSCRTADAIIINPEQLLQAAEEGAHQQRLIKFQNILA